MSGFFTYLFSVLLSPWQEFAGVPAPSWNGQGWKQGCVRAQGHQREDKSCCLPPTYTLSANKVSLLPSPKAGQECAAWADSSSFCPPRAPLWVVCAQGECEWGGGQNQEHPATNQDAVGDSASFPNCKLPGNIKEAPGMKGGICHSPCDLGQVTLTEPESCVVPLWDGDCDICTPGFSWGGSSRWCSLRCTPQLRLPINTTDWVAYTAAASFSHCSGS